MANFLIKLNGTFDISFKPDTAIARPLLDFRGDCLIHGKEGTFHIVETAGDTAIAIGYLCDENKPSLEESLYGILRSFKESDIGEIKKMTVGQYLLMLKKGQFLYIFSDFFGARNIFYTDDENYISSSYSSLENLLKPTKKDLDINKVFEFFAMRHILYPTWIGHATANKHIKWLMPYEYIVLDIESAKLRIGSLEFCFDNYKTSDVQSLSTQLISLLSKNIERQEFKQSVVGTSLTGGRDSRLVSAIVADKYPNARFRIAVSKKDSPSYRDLRVAERLAKVRRIPLDIMYFQEGRDDIRFRELTEGFAPIFNSSITPLIDNAHKYTLGFGGVFGTELFTPITFITINDYIENKIRNAKRFIKADIAFWDHLYEGLLEQFNAIRIRYKLAFCYEPDYIRLFTLLYTARYSSFFTAAFNQSGYQLEPYATYSILDLALRIAPKLWGNPRRLAGDYRIQKAALARLNPKMAKEMTFSSLRPMVPLSVASLPYYMFGATLQAGYWLKERASKHTNRTSKVLLSSGFLMTDGWEKEFIRRTEENYGPIVNVLT